MLNKQAIALNAHWSLGGKTSVFWLCSFYNVLQPLLLNLSEYLASQTF